MSDKDLTVSVSGTRWAPGHDQYCTDLSLNRMAAGLSIIANNCLEEEEELGQIGKMAQAIRQDLNESPNQVDESDEEMRRVLSERLHWKFDESVALVVLEAAQRSCESWMKVEIKVEGSKNAFDWSTESKLPNGGKMTFNFHVASEDE